MAKVGTCLWLLFIVASTTGCKVDQFSVVKTQTGRIQGNCKVTSDNFHYEEFLGVQYADFVGRFKKAVYPPQTHPYVVNATTLGNRCHQLDYIKFPLNQEDAEDCLNLNIYVPWGVKCLGSRKLPVVIGIHGGGFEIGSAAWIPGEELIKVARDVIFISIQYRLGIWGLLTTGDDVSPGNLLYWDQHYAIRWVHDNIQYFGGNPEEVTLWGFSAGGSSTAAQVLHKGNKGLIKRAIPVSAPGAYYLTGHTSCKLRELFIQHGKNVADALGCPTNPSWVMVECLAIAENAKLLEVSNRPELVSGRHLIERWFPVIDGEFFDDVTYQLFKHGRSQGVDFMHGFGQNDAGYFTLELTVPSDIGDKDAIFDYWKTFYSMYSGNGDPEKLMKEAEAKYGEDTYGYHPVTKEAVERENDRMRVTPHILDLKYHELFGGTNNNYLYVFDHHASYSHSPDWMTGDHLDTCVLTFGINLGFPEVFPTSEEEKELSRDMIRYQFNFAKTGDPNIGAGVPTIFPRWNMTSRQLIQFRATSGCGYTVESDGYKGVEEFWETLITPKDEIDKDKLCVQP